MIKNIHCFSNIYNSQQTCFFFFFIETYRNTTPSNNFEHVDDRSSLLTKLRMLRVIIIKNHQYAVLSSNVTQITNNCNEINFAEIL